MEPDYTARAAHTAIPDAELEKYSKFIGMNWQLMAYNLGLKQSQVNSLVNNYRGKSETLLYEMVKKWHDVVVRCGEDPRRLLAASFTSQDNNLAAAEIVGQDQLADVQDIKPSERTEKAIQQISFDLAANPEPRSQANIGGKGGINFFGSNVNFSGLVTINSIVGSSGDQGATANRVPAVPAVPAGQDVNVGGDDSMNVFGGNFNTDPMSHLVIGGVPQQDNVRGEVSDSVDSAVSKLQPSSSGNELKKEHDETLNQVMEEERLVNDKSDRQTEDKLRQIIGVLEKATGPLHASKVAQLSLGQPKSAVNRELYELRDRGILACDSGANWSLVKSITEEELRVCAASLAKRPAGKKVSGATGGQVTSTGQGSSQGPPTEVQRHQRMEVVAEQQYHGCDSQVLQVMDKLRQIMGVLEKATGPLHASKVAQLSELGQSKSAVSRELYALKEKGILACDSGANWSMVKPITEEELRVCAASLAKRPAGKKVSGATGGKVTSTGQGSSQGPHTEDTTILQQITVLNINAAENIQVMSHNSMIMMDSGERRMSCDSTEEIIADGAQQNRARPNEEATGASEGKKTEREKQTEEQESSRKSFEDIRKTSQLDGKIIEIGADWFEETIKLSEKIPKGNFGGVYNSGKYGEVYKYKEDARTLIIRRIPYEYHEDVEKHVNNEIFWGHLMHFAINPLLAKGRDAEKQIFYLVFPFMERGSLMEAITEDCKKIVNCTDAKNLQLMLGQKSRLSIIYQIAAGLAYMHKDVNNFRGAVSHGGIHSENILLDRHLNARLANFGNARREMIRTTEGSTLPDRLIQEYKDFGTVILELCFSQRLKGKENSQDIDRLRKDHKKFFTAVWKNTRVGEEILGLAKMCVQGTIPEEDYVKTTIEKIHRTVLGVVETWNVAEDVSDHCDVCVINPKIKDVAILKHTERCKVCVCVSCLRNSCLNPIECPSCHKDIKSPIGQDWGAILIAGDDEKTDTNAIFKNDINKVHEKITSKYPLVMGIDKELVFQIHAGQPNTQTPEQQLLEASQKLCRKNEDAVGTVTSLLVYYSGHYNKEKGEFLLDHKGNGRLNVKEFEQRIHAIQASGCHRVLIFLDCCNGPKLESSSETNPFIQVNSSRPLQESFNKTGEECSIFTSYFLKALSGKALQGKCLNESSEEDKCKLCKDFNPTNGFISVGELSEFIDKHVHMKGNAEMETMLSLTHVNWKDATIAYFIDKQVDFEFELRRDVSQDSVGKFQLHQLPETMSALKERLRIEFNEKDLLSKKELRDADILAITTSCEAENQDQSELGCMQLVVEAWNANLQLIVSPRPLDRLQLGKVGVFLSEATEIPQSIPELFGQDCLKDYCERETVGSVSKVTVAIGKVETLWQHLQDNFKGHLCHDVCNCLRDIKNDKEIQAKQGNLVICFQEVPSNYISFQIKDNWLTNH